MVRSITKIQKTVTLSENLVDAIDTRRGDVAFSKYLDGIAKKGLEKLF